MTSTWIESTRFSLYQIAHYEISFTNIFSIKPHARYINFPFKMWQMSKLTHNWALPSTSHVNCVSNVVRYASSICLAYRILMSFMLFMCHWCALWILICLHFIRWSTQKGASICTADSINVHILFVLFFYLVNWLKIRSSFESIRRNYQKRKENCLIQLKLNLHKNYLWIGSAAVYYRQTIRLCE